MAATMALVGIENKQLEMFVVLCYCMLWRDPFLSVCTIVRVWAIYTKFSYILVVDVRGIIIILCARSQQMDPFRVAPWFANPILSQVIEAIHPNSSIPARNLQILLIIN